MRRVYPSKSGRTDGGGPRYRGVSYVSVIDRCKERVRLEDLAERLCGPGVRRGRKIAFLCPLHDDHDPSLLVDPEKQAWFCFPCLVGGDSVELARRAWGLSERQAHVAAGEVLLLFGHEPLKRPRAWFAKQERQKKTREFIHETRIEIMARRLWRFVVAPVLRQVEDEAERRELAESLWKATRVRATELVRDSYQRRSA